MVEPNSNACDIMQSSSSGVSLSNQIPSQKSIDRQQHHSEFGDSMTNNQQPQRSSTSTMVHDQPYLTQPQPPRVEVLEEMVLNETRRHLNYAWDAYRRCIVAATSDTNGADGGSKKQ
mmetsp:Transcript_14953/g.17204  ORF Transcript_14953/g.17204 Transcript_14953/m.17204 type:complete len:117 (-) Transcript_14953:40-390(-)|eukprot:CAMPEP_0194354160 /NCGR_PEP_ID=MMETSP0174-20130528/2363_1 /TAXON_ID=216777 /ORGANISM="Proboscia alata, Strain PI-D3" /LENGTH=116 /DNA_ID=CAMNT_0039122989 /DNA_START=135 /DNA_END=485 /DNA_ORIENTATION=+